jgi:predicted metallopeptidase
VEFAKALGRMIESKVRFENLTVEDAIIEALAEVPRKFSGITEAHCSPALTILQKVEWMYAQEFTSWYQQNFEMPELSSMNLTEVSEAVPA